MTYIILAAGKGTKLQPLTAKRPKSLYRLASDTSILRYTIHSIRKLDSEAEIVVVVGFLSKQVIDDIADYNTKIVINPYYSVTGSMGSLWFARDFLQRENVSIINGDVVFSQEIIKDVICSHTDYPYVLLDSAFEGKGKYYVQTQNERVCVMSKHLTDFYGTYASVCKLDAVTARFLIEKVEEMVGDEMYDLFYEDALVQMIFENDFELYFKDISGRAWVEVDSVDDLLKAREISVVR